MFATARTGTGTAIGTAMAMAMAMAAGLAGGAFADEGRQEGRPPREAFVFEGRPAFVMLPAEERRTTPQPWVFYAPTLPAFPDVHEDWMHHRFLEAGIAVAGLDVGEAYGAAEATAALTRFHAELVRARGFAPRPCLLGRSRGGLWVTSWAAANPDKAAGLAGIYPVFDLRTYPGVEKAAPAHGVSAEELTARIDAFNPIAKVPALAKARIPAFLIHGDMDVVVPLEENSRAFQRAYEANGAGSLARLVVAEGQGHNYWEGFFRCRELVEFAIERARAGEEVGEKAKD